METKLQATLFYLVTVVVLEAVGSGTENICGALVSKFLLTKIIPQIGFC